MLFLKLICFLFFTITFSSSVGQVNFNIFESLVYIEACSDCEEKECTANEVCCQLFNSFMHVGPFSEGSYPKCLENSQEVKISLYLFTFYLSPPISPALRPPLFS